MKPDRTHQIESVLELLRSSGVTDAEVAAHLQGVASLPSPEEAVVPGLGTGDAQMSPDTTLYDVIDHAYSTLNDATADTYASSLRFLAQGWSITDDQRDDTATVLRRLKRAVPDFDQLPRVPGDDDRLEMWPGYGSAPAGTILRASLDVACAQARAAALVEGARRDRQRSKRGLPSLGWTGDQAVEHLIAAAAWMYTVLRDSSVVAPHVRPTADMTVPRREGNNRRENTDDELLELYEALMLYSPDPELAQLLFRYHLWTANRPIAARTLTIGGIDRTKSTMTSRTKYGLVHTVPAPPVLCDLVLDLAERRGSTEIDDPAFRTKSKARGGVGYAALNDNSHRRLLAEPVQDHVGWAAEQRWTAYWLRHTAKARIQQIGGPDCAIALLGHNDKTSIDKYGKAGISKLSWAVSVMTGQPHPLAEEPAYVSRLP